MAGHFAQHLEAAAHGSRELFNFFRRGATGAKGRAEYSPEREPMTGPIAIER